MNTDQQPWSPFPVQDWSTLPPDPLGSVAVNPTWPAPQPPQRSWWRPLVAYGLVAALVAGAAFVANSVDGAARATAAADYLPSDGAVSYERTDTTRELKTTVGLAVTESARLSGVAGLLSTDSAFATKMLDEAYADRDRIQILRTTTTAINDPAATAQTSRFYRVNTDVELLGISTPSEGYVYSPALVLLPADIRAGSQWSGAGSAGDTFDYRSELRAEAAAGDCLSVTGEVRYLSKEGQLARVVTVGQTWCPHEGIVAESQSFADIRSTTSRIDPPTPSIQTTTSAPILWSAPQRWTTRPMSTISINPTFGQGPMVGSPSTVTPVQTESGLVVRATVGRGDLVATTPKTPTEWTSIWRAHPGGTVLSLSAFGNVIIATTSNRQMVAYSDVGVRLWQLSLDDLAPTSPVRISDRDAVLVDLAGAIRRFDLSTGTVLWQHDIGSDANVTPAVGAGLVVIMDRAGRTTALEESTGQDRWERRDAGCCGYCRRRQRRRGARSDSPRALDDHRPASLGTADLRDADRHGEFRRPGPRCDQEPVRHFERRRCRHPAAGASPHADTNTRSSRGLGSNRGAGDRERWSDRQQLGPARADSRTTRPSCGCYLTRCAAVQQRLDVPGPRRCQLI